MRTLSLISEDDDGPNPVQQKKLSDNELQIIVPILNVFPHYCPYEVLLASIFSRTTVESTVANWRLRLMEAHNKGTWQQEIRPLRRALTSLRQKLYSFGLEISTIREKGYSITSTSPN
jgi:DNA-binding winged helix-turn-helix (wHTH) protein